MIARTAHTLIVAALLAAAQTMPAAAVPVEVELVWGRGGETVWDGGLSVDDGRILAVTAPQLEASEAATIVNATRLGWTSRTSGAIDGVRVMLDATEGSRITIETPLGKWATSLDELVRGEKRWRADGHWIGARLLARNFARLAGGRDSLIFRTNEEWDMSWEAFAGFDRESGQMQYSIRIQDDRTGESHGELASGVLDIPFGERIRRTDRIRLPDREGVYSLFIQLGHGRKTIPASRVQLVALDDAKRPNTAGARRLIQEIDPTRPAGPERFRDDGHSGVVEIGGDVYRQSGQRAERSNRKADDRDLSWFAYRLDIRSPGRPHMLEFVYPQDRDRRFLVSVIDKSEAGRRATGVHQGAVAHARPGAESVVRRIIFWPTTNQPAVAFINTLPGASAAAGRIRIYEFPHGLPISEAPADRMIGPYFEEAHIGRSLGGRMVADHGWLGGRDSRHDWITFYDAITNLAQTVRHRGENAVAITVFTYGASLYPSGLLPNNGRYDNGLLFDDGRDPVQKDVVRLMLEIFERYDVRLIPVFAFYSPLPELERRFPPDASGLREIDLVHRSGRSSRLERRFAGSVEAGPYYNPLHPAVQNAVGDVLQEFAQRYADSTALGDIAIQLNTTGWLQYPGMEWGYDRATIRRFVADNEIGDITDEQLSDAAHIYKLLNSDEMYPRWREWRNLEIKSFYESLAERVGGEGSGRELILAYMNTFTSRFSDDDPLRAWARKMTPREMLARKSVDPAILSGVGNMRIWRPLRTPIPFDDRQRRYTEISRSEASGDLFRQADADGVLNFHNYFESRAPSLERNWWWPADIRLVGTIIDPEDDVLPGGWFADKDYFYGGWEVVQ